MDAWRDVEVPDLPGRGPEPRLRDTATGELTVAATGQRASLYACGITPYDATHMGHAATFTAWDLLVRAWLDAGHDVTYTQNVTDVDDPLLERAERDGVDWRQLAMRETDLYRADMAALRVLPPTYLIGAVEALPLIDAFAERLALRGVLYDLDGDVYFARGSDPGFGALSGPDSAVGLSVAQMTALSAERGGDPDRPGKKDPLDVLVWRAERPGEPAWDSSFGRGRPGWHVECAAIATEYLGTAFDVQAGGSDLVFPHHEMSASHVRAACASDGRVFARVYAHSGMVAYQGAKMSKSLGNLVLVSRLRESGVDPMAIRLALLAHHYRSDWEWTDAVLATATNRLSRWRAAVSSAPASSSPAIPPSTAAPTSAGTSTSPAVPASADAPASAGTSTSAAVPASADAPASAGTSTSAAAPASADAPASAGTSTSAAVPASADALSSQVADSSEATPSSRNTPSAAVPTAEDVLSKVRERLAEDLDAPGALAAIDAWADAVLAAPPGSVTPADTSLIRDTADALLGVAL